MHSTADLKSLLEPTHPRASRRGGLASRALAAAWLAVYMLVAMALPIADARADHGESVIAHWEDANDTRCPPQHDLSECQLCQTIGAGSEPPPSAPQLSAVDRSSSRPTVVASAGHGRSPASSGISSRAPPRA